MLTKDLFETGSRRIGAEQETFLVEIATGGRRRSRSRSSKQPDEPRLTTELGRFNLELNLDSLEFGGTCLSQLEKELDRLLSKRGGDSPAFVAVVRLPCCSQDDHEAFAERCVPQKRRKP